MEDRMKLPVVLILPYRYAVHIIHVIQVCLAWFYKTGILQKIWSRWVNSIQPIRICVVTQELDLESFRTKNNAEKPSTQDSKSTRTCLHVQIPIRIFWQLLKKPIGSTFWRRIALHLRGFTKNEIDSRLPYNVMSYKLLAVIPCRFF